MNKTVVLFRVLLVAFLIISCGEEEGPDPVCEAGLASECPCSGEETGIQTCADDGSQWLECICDGSDGDADGDGDGDACEFVTCSGHGACDEAEDGTPECDCDDGYAGDDCSNCDDGYHLDGENCVVDETCEGIDCSDHGTCAVLDGSASCECETGYTGDDCGDCYPGYHEDVGDCVLDETCLESSCAGHGSCSDDYGVVTCECEEGYGGDSCAECTDEYHRERENCIVDETCEERDCSSNGTCVVEGGLASCSCDAGYTGNDCESCYEGYHNEDGSCVLDETCVPGSCSGRGTCDDSSAVVVCECMAGYGGDYCEERVASFHGLGDLPGGDYMSRAWAVSADGTVVVGHSDTSDGDTAFRWTDSEGIVSIGSDPEGSICWPTSVNHDGSTIIGKCAGAFRWTAATGMVPLDGAPGDVTPGSVADITPDGAVIVGSGGHQAFRWTSALGAVGLGWLSDSLHYSYSEGVSDDGSVVVGMSIGVSDYYEPFIWTVGTGMTSLGHLSATSTFTGDCEISGDGTVIIGRSGTSVGQEAFRWTFSDGMSILGDLPGRGTFSIPHGISEDGAIIVGDSESTLGYEAFIWDEVDGMRSLRDVLISEYGLDEALSGWALGGFERFPGSSAATGALAITPDGSTIVGVGTNPDGNWEAWRAVIPRE